MKIGVIGAGHAGVAAAETAARAGVDVVLFSAEQVLPYFRPRLVALAFDQVEEGSILMHPEHWYRKSGIHLQTDVPVKNLDAAKRIVVSRNEQEAFDAIIIAMGAGPAIPSFARNVPAGVVPLWNIQHARDIRSRIKTGARILIIGGGVIGIEAALRASDAGLSVTVVEMMERLMAGSLNEKGSGILLSYLERPGVEVLTGGAVAAISQSKIDRVLVRLQSGKEIVVDLVLLSIGARRDLALIEQAGLVAKNGICVDSTLRTSVERVFACGDIAQFDGITRSSALAAVVQGRLAGANACAVLSGTKMQEYKETQIPLAFKYKGLEIRGGDVFVKG